MKGHRKRFNANWFEEKKCASFLLVQREQNVKRESSCSEASWWWIFEVPGPITFIWVLFRFLSGGVPWAGDVQRGQLVHQRCATSVLDGKPSGGQDDDYNVNIADYSNDHDHKNKADNVFLSRVVTTRSECERSATTLSPSPTRRSKPHVRSPFCFF